MLPRFIAVLCATLALVACSGKGNDDGKPPDPTPSVKKDAAVAPPPVEDAAPRAEVPRIPDEFVTVGVATCDEYIEKQRKCLEEKAPENIRKPQLLGLRQIAAKWAEASKDRESQLEKTCAHMLESSKRTTSTAWGCSW